MNDSTSPHLPALSLRRLRADELGPDEAAAHRSHLEGCASCREKLRVLDEEQTRFEAAVPFERFAAGVERAARAEARAQERSAQRARLLERVLPRLLAVSAAFVLVALVSVQLTLRTQERNRLKGGAEMVARVAGAEGGPQRSAASGVPEVLSPGERVRLGFTPGGHRYVAAIAVDAAGVVTPLYPESGESLAITGAQTQYLPDSLEFEGRGAERVVLVLSDSPLDMDALAQAAKEAYTRARGNVLELPLLDVPGEQFHRTFLKP